MIVILVYIDRIGVLTLWLGVGTKNSWFGSGKDVPTLAKNTQIGL